jgi:hypothetical protein
MIWAEILQRRPPGDFGASIERGTFGFLQLPNANDEIQILNERGRCDLLQVKYVQHTPASNAGDPKQPVAHIICDFVAEISPPPQSK